MNQWLKTWRSQRELRSLQWWEQKRAKGRSQFILRTALTFGLTMTATFDIFEHVFYGGAHSDRLLFRFISYLFNGIIMGFFGWRSWEGKYQKALLKARAGAMPGDNAVTKQISNK
jgi:hypothetical protein